jgi:SAM-dependent methyltransferase
MPRQTQEQAPERFVPDEMRGQLVQAEQIARYRWAASFCSGRRVLDAGCGVGYGSELIGRAGATEVVALDISEAALELAKSAVSTGVTFELGDVGSLSHADDSFDVVVCFELIEQVDELEPLLDELARVLRPEGLLLVSTPNRDRDLPGDPHHQRELARSELQTVLDARFGSARIISQHVMLASVIGGPDSPRSAGAETERVAEAEPEDETHLLAMAGAELPSDPGPMVVLARFAEARRWLDHIVLQKRLIDDQTRQLEDFAGRDVDRRAALERLAEAEQKVSGLRTQEADLVQTRQELAAANERLAAASIELDQLRSMASTRSWQLANWLRKVAAQVRHRRP